MTNSSILLYKKAYKYLQANKIKMISFKGNKERDFFQFDVNGYETTLTLTKHEGKTGIWKREWSCTCPGTGIRNLKYNERCKHVIACEYWLGGN